LGFFRFDLIDDFVVTLTGGYAPIHVACKSAHERVVQRLLAHGVDLEAPGRDLVENRPVANVRPLHVAAEAGACAVVRALLAKGAQVDSACSDASCPTPLHWAAVGSRVGNCTLESCRGIPPTVEEERGALAMVRKQRQLPVGERERQPALYCTVGVHPTRCLEFEHVVGEDGARGAAVDPDAHLAALQAVVDDPDAAGCVVAVGECGLDYDRLEFCPKEVQLAHFERQFALAERTRLPMFLHCRNAAADMLALCAKHRHRFTAGVIHSFDGTAAEAAAFVELGLHIGINGCSLKTAENVAVVRDAIPVEKLMIETDAPWCDIRKTHASFGMVASHWPQVGKPDKWKPDACVKGRNEPCMLRQVLEVVAACKASTPEEIGPQILRNTNDVFFPQQKEA